MLKEAIDRILELATPHTIAHDGRTYVDKPMRALQDPLADALGVNTLTAIRDYINNEVDGGVLEEEARFVVHVEDYNCVKLYKELNEDRARECFLLAHIDNRVHGALTGYECPECLNRGTVFEVRGSSIVARECRCMSVRRSLRRIEESGLRELVEANTFERYEAKEAWQREIKAGAIRYVREPEGRWFFLGGQSGSGKTHICTAIVAALMRRGVDARYMLWRDAAVEIKAVVGDDAAYRRLVEPLKTVRLLYVDDFWKTRRGEAPTAADVNLAFEILNARYNRRGLLTVISSEREIEEILQIDEAVGGRIYQRCREFCFGTGRNDNRNYRLKG